MESKGFSLLELLVVLAVMGVMMAVLGFTFLTNSSSDLGNTQRALLSYIQKTKSLSVSSGAEARLIVSADHENPEKYLRHLQIIVLDKNYSNELQQWAIADSGFYLPKDVWFIADGCGSENSDLPRSAQCAWSASDQDDYFRLKLVKNNNNNKVFEQSSEGQPFLYLSCLPSGKISCPTYPKMPKLIFAKGKMVPSSSGDFIPAFPDSSQVAGIQILPFGGTLSLETADFSDE